MSSPYASRPAVVLAMRADLTPDLLGEEQWRHLDRVARLVDRSPLASFTGPAADAALGLADVLLTGWGCPRIDADVLARAPRLRFVAHTGSSIKPLVSDALWERGIMVSSAAAANAIPVAEFALAAILLANKSAFATREDYRARRAPLRHPWTAPGETGNFGAIVGIVGASRTGRHLLRLLLPFSIQALVYDPIARAEEIESLGARLVSLDELASSADILSIHAPSLPQTRHLIDRRILARLRNGATIVNTARGDVVDQAALEDELASGRLSAVLDVTDPEPAPSHSRLFDLPNVFLTPHIAGAAGHETRRLADLAIADIDRFSKGEPVHGQITADMLSFIG
jgi:phosphoglycerate dehydrogenase-like enzyme